MNDLWSFLDANPNSRQEIYDKAFQGYTVDGISEDKLNFVELDKLTIGLERFKNLHYSLEVPEFNGHTRKKLIVLFVPADGVGRSSAKDRYFGLRQWNTLSKSIFKNVVILRVADVGFVSGSYYILYEREIYELIEKVKREFSLNHEDVVLYGNSRGATGALLLGISGNYKTVSVDPVIDRLPWVQSTDGRFDRQLMFDFIEMDFSERIIERMNNSRYSDKNITVLAADANKEMFKKISYLSSGFKLENLKLNITSNNTLGLHGITIMESVPFQLALINKYLFN